MGGGEHIYMVSVYGLGLRVWGLGFSFYEPRGEGKAIRSSQGGYSEFRP